MRATLAALAMLVLAASSGGADQGATTQAPGTGQPPTFRAGVDVLTVDVVALDGSGRPVTDLQASEFTVRVNGQVRKVVSADLVRMDADAAASASPSTPASASSVSAARGRRIVIAVDQQNIRPGAITPLLNAASRFVDRLTPRDQVAFVTFPPPGPHVDLTSDKARVRAAMQGLVGQPSQMETLEYSMGLSEAITLRDREGNQIPATENPNNPKPDPPVMAALLERNCVAADGQGRDACRRAFLEQADRMVQLARRDATISTRAIEGIITSLASLEGPKSLVLVSPGLLINNQDEIDGLIRQAEGSRTSVYVLAVEAERENGPLDVKPTAQGPTTSEDRRLRIEGLTAISTPGGFYNVTGSGDVIFDRLATELSAYYLLGVESRAGDQSRPRQKVSVETRRGVRARASLAFAPTAVAAAAPTVPRRRSIEDDLRETLAAPSGLTDLSLDVATLVQRDPKSDKARVNLAAQIAPPATPPEIFVVGYLVTDKAGTEVASSANGSTLVPGAAAGGRPLDYLASVLLDPGAYSLRVGVVDSEGRRGSVVRELTVRRMTGEELTTSDLLAGNPPAAGQALAPTLEPRVTAAQLAAYVELYSTKVEDLEWTTVDFEIAKSADGPALTGDSGELANGPQPSWRVAQALLDVDTLEAGNYVVRAKVVLDSKTLVTLVRPFVLERK
jgi:VWFA-related protein